MLLSYRRFILPSIFLFIAVAASWAQIPMSLNREERDITPQQVRELVSKYCRLDYDGTRLDPQGWAKLQPLVWWKTNPDYAHVDVISRYTVETTPVLSHGKYTVKVQYRSLGQFEMGVGYSRQTESSREVEYTVTAENGEWRISDAEPNFPHLSRTAILKWLNDEINTTQDPAAKSLYQEAVQKLQAQPAAPVTK